MSSNGERFLEIIYDSIYDDLIDSDKRKGKTKEESIKLYLDRIEEMHQKASKHHKIDIVKQLYYDKYVIKKEDIPNYIRGTYISADDKDKIILEQKKGLGEWIDYLTDENAKYPMWAKYWVFQQMLKIGSYDEMSGKYTKRTKETTKPYLEANPEIIAKCIETVQNLLGENNRSIQQIRKIIGNLSFGKMYAEYAKKSKKNIKTNTGRWVKYNQGSEEEAKKLCNSLKGYDTKWCTSSESMAINQVCGGGGYVGGDFYVFYTLDEKNEYKVPRIAIRLDGHIRIGEIRGIELNQNLEEEMIGVLESKLKEMNFLNRADVQVNLKIVNDLRYLVAMKEKTLNNILLSSREVMDLYIKKYGFGWEQDPLVRKIIAKRSISNDYKIVKELSIEEKIRWIENSFELWDEKEKEFIDEKELAYVVVNQHWSGIKYINSNVEGYKDIAANVVRQHVAALQYVNSKINGYKEMAMEAVQENGMVLQYVNPKSRYYKEIAIKAVQENGMAIKYVNSNVERYNEIAMIAVHECGFAIKYVDSKVEGYKEIAIKAVQENGMAIKYVDPNANGFEEIVLVAVNDSQILLDLKDYLVSLKNGNQNMKR